MEEPVSANTYAANEGDFYEMTIPRPATPKHPEFREDFESPRPETDNTAQWDTT